MCVHFVRSRWKPKRRLIHSRLRLTVIAVVWLVGRVCVALIVALERKGNRETEWDLRRGLFMNHECQDVPKELHLNWSRHAPLTSWASEITYSCVDGRAIQSQQSSQNNLIQRRHVLQRSDLATSNLAASRQENSSFGFYCLFLTGLISSYVHLIKIKV